MRILGILIFAAVSACLLYDYTRSQRARMAEYEVLSALFCDIERRVAEGGRALSEAIRSFDFPKYKREELKEALLSADLNALHSQLTESDDADLSLLSDFFSESSAPSVDEELKRIRKFASHFKERYCTVKREYPDRARVALILYSTAVVFAFFLLI